MSKTAIDFFSKGLDGHKTKLSVSVFGLDVKYQIREMAQKRKTSLPHFNCGRIQKRHDKQQLDYVSESNKNNKMASTFTSFNSCNLSPTRSSNIKNQGDTIHSLPYSKRQINLEQIVNLKEQLKPKTTKIPQLIDIENRSKNKFEPILRITEVCEPHEESFGSNGYAIDKNLQTEKYISQQLNDRKKQADCRIRLSQNLETKKKKNYYFISNLVLQTSEPQRSSIQHHHISQQRRIGVQNMRYLQSIKTNLAQSKKQKQDTKQEIKLPNSLKARKIVYFSCSDKPLKKKQRSKKSILLIQSKSPKVAKNVDFGIDRWEYKKDEVNSWDF